MWLIEFVFPQFWKPNMSKYGYLEVFQSPFGIRDNGSRLYFTTTLNASYFWTSSNFYRRISALFSSQQYI